MNALSGIGVAAALLATVTGAMADPLSDLLATGKGSACFERTYDDAHLARNPGQRTRTVLLSLTKLDATDGAVLRLRFERSHGARYVVGDCYFAARANLDGMGEKLIPEFKGPAGLDCHAMTDADGSSAEEGGDFAIDLRDGRSVVVYTSDSLAGWPSPDRGVPATFMQYRKDDSVFRADRVAASRCAALVAELKWID
jgi:hypothetical protein